MESDKEGNKTRCREGRVRRLDYGTTGLEKKKKKKPELEFLD